MKVGDYSPPALPSLDQQRDALQKGLGRAMQWALSGRLDDEPLLETCLTDKRFDGQVDGPRGFWLWQMIEVVSARERFRVPLLHALYDLADERSESQLCQLAQYYAAAGDETFRSRLYEIVEQKPVADTRWLGEEEIITLDGGPAFLFAARVRGIGLAGREWEWDDRNLVDVAMERLGEEQVKKLLASSSDEAIKQFWHRWQHEVRTTAEHGQDVSYKERMAAIPVEEVIQAAESDSRWPSFRGWGMYADELPLRTVLQRLWSINDPKAIANLLKVFSARKLPEFDARLIELCNHSDEEVRRRAFPALAQNVHPLIRQFALTEIRKGVRDGSVVALFVNNYQHGDEQRILEAIEFTGDEWEFHWLLMDSMEVLEKNPQADCSSLGVIAYAMTPCENCRSHAARLLVDRHVAPEWLKRECPHDSCEDCRALVAGATGSTDAD